jgi:HprK-related kinase A
MLRDVSPSELARRLAGPGVRLRTGPFVTEIRSRLPSVARGLALLYDHHPLEPVGGFADFHVELARPRSARRWLMPQVRFRFDGTEPFHALPAGHAFPILEWGLNWCISTNCHQYLILHGAVLEHGGRALLLPAPPGSGKSTLCAALVSRGWRLLSDELTLIQPDTGEIVPLVRAISLKNESIAVISRFSPKAVLGPTVNDTIKGAVAHMKAPADSVRRAHERAYPAWIVSPRYEAGAPARLESLSKGRTFMELADGAFNYHLQGRRGFESMARLVAACSCHRFHYPDLDVAVKTIQELTGIS